MDSPTSAAAPTSTMNRVESENDRPKTLQSTAISKHQRPLTLLDLPVDILQLIVKEITHTNDLAALALTNSALHGLAIPHIYSRFDIVWPDAQVGTSESKSVDALTYGLSTLSVGSAFARAVSRSSQRAARHPSKLIDVDYAKYTRKFSLGNGPSDWVAEYAVHKESGKMLGTLVASAITKMRNLESFTWDMPTGVLSRVFEALSSLADEPDSECKLSRVWVRWHDNSQRPGDPDALSPNDIVNGTALVPQGSQITPVGIMLPPNAVHPPPRSPVRYSEYHCEYPTFSVLPPLESLTVLDIDEIGYLDEMAVLVERSKDILQELRVSISPKAASQAFAQTWDGPGLKQIDHRARWPGGSTIGDRRLGGVLGVLVGKIYDIKKRRTQEKVAVPAIESITPSTEPVSTTGQVQVSEPAPLTDGSQAQQAEGKGQTLQDGPTKTQPPPQEPAPTKPSGRKRLEGKLKLRTLELERVVLSLHVCRYAIDWSVLTNLTLLDCAQHDNLWKMLRKQFRPTPVSTNSGVPLNKAPANGRLQYHLALKAIHTDTATVSLVNFIRETLAPNSLEDLFLQDRKRPSPPLPLDTIFKGAIKRHCVSLRRLLLDSSAKQTSDNLRWRQWALSTDIVLYITSGRMKNLRELAASFEYRDWHTFLQRLPNISQLRSLNIQHLADYPTGGYDPREIAHQMVDIVSLRPEIRLCYVGAGPKCFEILESRATGKGKGSARPSASSSGASTPVTPAAAGLTGLGVVGNWSNGGGSVDDGLGSDLESEDIDETEDEEEEDVVTVDVVPADVAGTEGDEAEEEEDDDDDEGEEEDDSDAEEGEEDDVGGENGNSTHTTAASDPGPDETLSEEDEGDETEEEEVEQVATVPVPAGAQGQAQAHLANNDSGYGDDDEDDDDGFVEPAASGVRLKLREILFYDDKVAIFRARHGRL